MECGIEFPNQIFANGVRSNFGGRKRCLDCLPHRPLKAPRTPVRRAIGTRVCGACNTEFPLRAAVDGRLRTFYRRRFCMTCSPIGLHNTSQTPLGLMRTEELLRERRRRKYRQTYSYQKKRRALLKSELIAERGGRCEACGYNATHAAMEFHHRDSESKKFGLGSFSGTRARLAAEAAKCALLCANCHRIRHLALQSATGSVAHQVPLSSRQARKARAVLYMGGTCFTCNLRFPDAALEFHHRESRSKEFGISQTGTPNAWDKVRAELEKCVMLCANCHREVHAGVRDLVETLLGLAEPLTPYHAISA